MRAYKVYAIEHGTVIDHIPGGSALKIIDILGIKNQGILTIGMNFLSKKLGKKDVIKIENKELSQNEVNKLALIAPTATINIIKKQKVVKKINAQIPDVIEGIVKCSNPNCITNKEGAKTKFFVLQKKPVKLRCNYCERCMKAEDVVLL